MATAKNRHIVRNAAGLDVELGENKSLLRNGPGTDENKPNLKFSGLKRLIRTSALAMLLSLPLKPFADSGVTLAWDKSADPIVAGYNVYYGGISRAYTNVMDAGSKTNLTITGLREQGTYFFAATTYSADGMESPFSGEVNYTVPGILLITPGANPNDPVLTTSLPQPNTIYPSVNSTTKRLTVSCQLQPGHWAEFQATQNLGDPKSWKTVWQTTKTTSTAVYSYTDPQSAKLSSRFYRVVIH